MLRVVSRNQVQLSVGRTILGLVHIEIVFADWTLVLFLDEESHTFRATTLGRWAAVLGVTTVAAVFPRKANFGNADRLGFHTPAVLFLHVFRHRWITRFAALWAMDSFPKTAIVALARVGVAGPGSCSGQHRHGS